MSTLGIGTRADRFANKIQGRGKCDAWLTFRRGPGPNIVRWVYHLFLGLHGAPTPARSAVTWYLVFKRDVGFGSIGASGKQNRVRVRFPRPQTNNKDATQSDVSSFWCVYLHTHPRDKKRYRERQGRIEKLIKLPVMETKKRARPPPRS